MMQLLIRANDRDVVGTSIGDGSRIGKMLSITDHWK